MFRDFGEVMKKICTNIFERVPHAAAKIAPLADLARDPRLLTPGLVVISAAQWGCECGFGHRCGCGVRSSGWTKVN